MMKKLVSLVLAMLMILSLAACGGEEAPYLGTYSFASGDDAAEFDITLEKGGKGSMSLHGDRTEIKWSHDNAALTIEVEGEEINGTFGEGTIVFDDFGGLGMKMTFVKEGTDLTTLQDSILRNEEKMVGTWTSYKVIDVLGGDASFEVAVDALIMDFKADQTVDITFRGEKLEKESWSLLGTFGTLDADVEEKGYDFTWDIVGDEIKVTYSDDEDNYWIFTCKK